MVRNENCFWRHEGTCKKKYGFGQVGYEFLYCKKKYLGLIVKLLEDVIKIIMFSEDSAYETPDTSPAVPEEYGDHFGSASSQTGLAAAGASRRSKYLSISWKCKDVKGMGRFRVNVLTRVKVKMDPELKVN